MFTPQCIAKEIIRIVDDGTESGSCTSYQTRMLLGKAIELGIEKEVDKILQEYSLEELREAMEFMGIEHE